MAPIDVWIQRLIDEEFGGRDPFPAYGQQAGIVQQYLFYYKPVSYTHLDVYKRQGPRCTG